MNYSTLPFKPVWLFSSDISDQHFTFHQLSQSRLHIVQCNQNELFCKSSDPGILIALHYLITKELDGILNTYFICFGKSLPGDDCIALFVEDCVIMYLLCFALLLGWVFLK